MAPSYAETGVSQSIIETYQVKEGLYPGWKGGVGKTDGSAVDLYLTKGDAGERSSFTSEEELLAAMAADGHVAGEKLSENPQVVGFRQLRSHGDDLPTE